MAQISWRIRLFLHKEFKFEMFKLDFVFQILKLDTNNAKCVEIIGRSELSSTSVYNLYNTMYKLQAISRLHHSHQIKEYLNRIYRLHSGLRSIYLIPYNGNIYNGF